MGDNTCILRTLYVYLQPLWYNRPENLSNSDKKTQNKGYYGVQGHSRSSRSVPIESPYAISYIIVISNWHPISYRFDRVIAAYYSNFAVFTQVLRLRRYERQYRAKIGDFAPTRSLWSEISGKGSPPPIIFARLVRAMDALQLCRWQFSHKETF